MTRLILTAADRDEHGRIRTLAELLPAKEAPQSAPTTPPLRVTRKEIAASVAAGLAAVALLVLLRGSPAEQPAATVTIRPTAAPAVVALPTVAPTAQPQQPAYAAPDGALLGTVPAGLPAGYRYGESGWAGVEWQGAIVWVRADAAALAGLPDLRPQPTTAPVWSAPAPALAPVEAPPVERKALGQKQHDELPCWKGPPAPYQDGQIACWPGVPFVTP